MQPDGLRFWSVISRPRPQQHEPRGRRPPAGDNHHHQEITTTIRRTITMITIQPFTNQLLEVFTKPAKPKAPPFKSGKVPQPKHPPKPPVSESTKRRIALVEAHRSLITERLALDPESPTGLVWKVTVGNEGRVGYRKAGTVAGATGRDPVVVLNGQRLSIRLIIALLSVN